MDARAESENHTQSPHGWAAQLDIHFEQRESKTKVAHCSHFGPLRIQRPFYPEMSGTAHVYVLHPPGGVAGGDTLTTTIECGERTSALITTPAATKLYRSIGPRCRVAQLLTVHEDALLEWLPQETIAFSGAEAELKTLVYLDDGAQFIGWELLCLGRPASGDCFALGSIDQRVEVWRNGVPLFIDRLVVGQGSPVREAAWGMNRKSVVATMFIVSDSITLLPLVRSTLELCGSSAESAESSTDNMHSSAGSLQCTALRGLILIRYVGDSVPECWDAFVRVWEAVRPSLRGSPAVVPRIWAC